MLTRTPPVRSITVAMKRRAYAPSYLGSCSSSGDLIGQSEPQGTEPEAASSDESSNDIDDEDAEAIAAVEHSLLRAPLVEPDARGCANDLHLRHRVSGVVHVKKDLFALLCGRSRSENYEGLPEGSQLDAFCLCKQCATVDPSFGHKED